MSVNRAKGTRFETDVVNFLNKQLGKLRDDGSFKNPTDPMNVRRQAQTGRYDVGDAWAAPFALEMKNVAKIDLAAFVKQANQEAINAGLDFGTSIVKKRGASVSASYVVLDLATFARVLQRIREG